MSSVFFVSLMSAAPWGGSEELWFRTAKLAIEKGWKVSIAVYHWKEKEKKLLPLSEAGAAVYYLPNKGRSKKNLVERIQNKISKARIKSRIQHLPFKEHDLTIVNMGAFEVTMPAWQSLPGLLSKYMVLFHNYREKEIFSGRQKEVIQNLISHSESNLFASRRIAEVLIHNSGIKVSKQEILINPITFDKPQYPESFPPLTEGNYQMVMLAALEINRKAQDILIHALSTPEWKSRNWTLHLYGSGKDETFLRSLIEKMELQSKVFLEGHTNNVRFVLKNAHLLLQITHQDAMPLSVVEAMAMARPVVVSKIGDMPYWVKENESGWIVEEATVQQVRKKLELAWMHRKEWEQMGKASFELFQQNFPDSPELSLFTRMESILRKNDY